MNYFIADKTFDNGRIYSKGKNRILHFSKGSISTVIYATVLEMDGS